MEERGFDPHHPLPSFAKATDGSLAICITFISLEVQNPTFFITVIRKILRKDLANITTVNLNLQRAIFRGNLFSIVRFPINKKQKILNFTLNQVQAKLLCTKDW